MPRLLVSRKLIFIVFLAIFLVHGWATLTAAYFYYWWLDIVMHIAGGLWVGIITIYFIRDKNFSPLIALWLIFGFAAIIGLFWEFFEFAFGFMQQGLEDTLSDLLSDLIGSVIAFSLFKARGKNYNKEQ